LRGRRLSKLKCRCVVDALDQLPNGLAVACLGELSESVYELIDLADEPIDADIAVGVPEITKKRVGVVDERDSGLLHGMHSSFEVTNAAAFALPAP
jgi:hypothetical protein